MKYKSMQAKPGRKARGIRRGFFVFCALLGLAVGSPAADHLTYGIWHSGKIGSGGHLQHVVFCPSDARRMYMSSDVGGLFRSDDGGMTWRMLHGNVNDTSSYSVRGLLVSSADPDRIVAAFGDGEWGNGGVWRSDDGGKTWRQTLKGRFDGNGDGRGDGYVLVRDPRNEKVLWAAPVGDGLYRSDDEGETWTKLQTEPMFPRDMLVDLTDSNRLWLVTGWKKIKVNGKEVTCEPGILLTEDAGKNWQRLGKKAPNEMVQDRDQPGALYGLFRPEQVQRSLDKGRTWEPFNKGLPPYPANAGARDDGVFGAVAAVPGFVVIGSHGGEFYRLAKGSDQWEKIVRQSADEGDWWGSMKQPTYRHYGSAMSFVGVDPHDSNHWVFTDWYALYQTWDAGKNWKLCIDGVEMTVVHVVAQDPGDRNTAHVGVADVGYFRSTDGGTAFKQINQGISNNIKHIAVSPSDPKRLYAVGPQRWEWHANQVFMSRDGGDSWTRSPMKGLPDMEKARCNTVAVHPRKPDEAYLVLNGEVAPNKGGVWKSTNGGGSWTWMGQGLPEKQSLFRTDIWVAGPELAVSADGSLLAGSDDRNRLFRYDPDDAQWQEVKIPNRQGGVNAVAADPGNPGRYYLCSKEGGFWRSEDSGKTWSQLAARNAWSVAVDINNPRRIAFNGGDGIFISRDEGSTWLNISRDLPYRHLRNVLCFAGDRLIVGTGGNGVFWGDVSETALNALEKGGTR